MSRCPLAVALLGVLPAIRVVQWAWSANGAEGVASGTTISACRESGGRWVANMCVVHGERYGRSAAATP